MRKANRAESNKQVSGSLPDHDTPPPPAASATPSHETSPRDVETVIETLRPVSSVAISDSVPETSGRFRIVKPLGEGAMGSVYLADDTQLRRPVALNVPRFSADSRSPQGMTARMRVFTCTLLLCLSAGCGPEAEPTQTTDRTADAPTQAVPDPPAESDAESGDRQPPPRKDEATDQQSVSDPAMTPDAAAVRKQLTSAQLALGDPVVNSVDMLLVAIPAGEFQMGSPNSDSSVEDNETPQHPVTITKPFYLGVCEVTQSQYERVMDSRPWQGRIPVKEAPDYPATCLNHDDAVEFCRRLSKREGVEYRLPTEAEWEYACRAGTATTYSFGDDTSRLEQYAWYARNAWNRKTGARYAHRVGTTRPNPWSLYDMHGNVFEWCQDWYARYGSETALSDPAGPQLGTSRVLRGGAFGGNPSNVRSAVRYSVTPAYRHNAAGFRVARTYP